MSGTHTSGIDQRLLLALPILGAFAAKPILLVVSTWEEWLTVDYTLRLLFLIYVFLIPSVRAEAVRMFGRSWPKTLSPVRAMTFVAVVIAAVMVEFLIDEIRQVVYALIPGTDFFNYFEIENQFWLIVDLTLGLLLVAITEELSFRGFVIRILGNYLSHPIVLVLVSALIFGLVHWTNGLHNIVATGLTGIVLGSIYIWSKSLWPCVIIHYIINVGYFWPS